MNEHIHDDHDFAEEDEEMIITLTLDDGEEVECSVLTVFTAEENGQDYIALLPVTEDEDEASEVYLYRFSVDEDDNPILDNIDDDEEYEIASDAFDELLDSEEFDELYDEDDDYDYDYDEDDDYDDYEENDEDD